MYTLLLMAVIEIDMSVSELCFYFIIQIITANQVESLLKHKLLHMYVVIFREQEIKLYQS